MVILIDRILSNAEVHIKRNANGDGGIDFDGFVRNRIAESVCGQHCVLAAQLGAAALAVNHRVIAAIRVDARLHIVLLDGFAGQMTKRRCLICFLDLAGKHAGIDGEEDFAGIGVSYCATCDGAFFKKKDVAVIGGGDVALEDAIFLSRLCNKVYIVHRRDTFRAAKSLVTSADAIENIEFVFDSVSQKISGNSNVEELSVKNVKTDGERTLPVSGVFIAIGITPATGLFKDLVACDEAGYILADESGKTSMPGIFAAGDIRKKPLRQIITAAADGANCITSVEGYLAM